MQLHFPLNEKHLPFQIHDINIDGCAEERSYFGFILLCDDFVVEDRGSTIPHARNGR